VTPLVFASGMSVELQGYGLQLHIAKVASSVLEVDLDTVQYMIFTGNSGSVLDLTNRDLGSQAMIIALLCSAVFGVGQR